MTVTIKFDIDKFMLREAIYSLLSDKTKITKKAILTRIYDRVQWHGRALVEYCDMWGNTGLDMFEYDEEGNFVPKFDRDDCLKYVEKYKNLITADYDE